MPTKATGYRRKTQRSRRPARRLGGTRSSLASRGYALVMVSVGLFLVLALANRPGSGSPGALSLSPINLLASPLLTALGCAAYSVPLLLAATGASYILRLHYSRRAKWVLRASCTPALLAGLLAGVADSLRKAFPTGGWVGALTVRYATRATGTSVGPVLVIPITAVLLCSLWGLDLKRCAKALLAGARHGARGIAHAVRRGLGHSSGRRRTEPAAHTGAAGALPGERPLALPDENWMPALDGNWLNADELAAPETPGQSADDGLPCEAMLKPLPAPEPDLPLPLGILPAMAAADEDTSALTDKLAGMQRLITQVVGNTTGIDLRPAGSPEVGLTAIGFEFEKSPGQTGSVNRLAGALADLGLALRRAPVRLAIGATVRFEVPLRSEERRFVPILPLLREVQPAPDTDEVRLLLGRRHDGSPYELELTQARHILVGGSTGGGKTVLLHSMIFGLAFRYAPSAVRLALFDPKVFEFSRYKGLPHLWHEVVTTEEGYMCLVDNLADELERRKRARQADPMATFPALVTIIDEFRGFDCPKLIQIIAQARALRMYFVLATQHPTANVISTAIKANLTTGIALRVRDSTASRLIIGDQGAESLLPYGDCLVQGPDGLVRIQAGWVRDAPDTDLPRLQAHLEAPTERPDTPPDTRGESAGEPVDPIPAAAE